GRPAEGFVSPALCSRFACSRFADNLPPVVDRLPVAGAAQGAEVGRAPAVLPDERICIARHLASVVDGGGDTVRVTDGAEGDHATLLRPQKGALPAGTV